MKKVICLLLVLTCTFGLFACGKAPAPSADDESVVDLTGKANENGKVSFTDEQMETFNSFLTDIDENSPTKVVTLVDYMLSGVNYHGSYTSRYDGAKLQYDYKYQAPALVEDDLDLPEDSTSVVAEKSGSILYKAGRISTDDGATWQVGEPPLTTPSTFELDLSLFDTATLTGKNNVYTLKATVSGENVAKVFGNTVAASGAVSLTVVIRNGYLSGSTVTYTSAQGADTTVNSSYTYDAVALNF